MDIRVLLDFVKHNSRALVEQGARPLTLYCLALYASGGLEDGLRVSVKKIAPMD